MAQVASARMVLHVPSGGGDSTFSGTGTAGFSSTTGFVGTSGALKILVSFTSRWLKGREIYTTFSSQVVQITQGQMQEKFTIRSAT